MQTYLNSGLSTGRSLISMLLLIMLSMTQGAFAQKKEKKLLRKARASLEEADYQKAKERYQTLIELDSSTVNYPFECGLAYYNSNVEKSKSLHYFQMALRHSSKDTIAEIFYYLGRAYQFVEDFEHAIDAYNDFKRYVLNNNQGFILARDVDRYIEMCNNGEQYVANPNKNVTIKNLGDKVNSDFPEYAPVMKDDESLVIYTARKKGSTGGKFYHDDKYFEDIYFSQKDEDGNWEKSQKVDSANYIKGKVNTKKHDAAITFSIDEQKLFIYRENHVWMSRFENDQWQEPERMNDNINSRLGEEMSVYMTADEQTLFVVSTRKGGYGGKDIYKSRKKSDDTWGPLENLGPTINTPFDDDAPFLAPDGKTLYFSSKGHTTMGGFDVFKTRLQDDSTWTVPENLGAPINTPGDDIYYITNRKETVGFYASDQQNGYGDMDIYRIQLECENIPFTEVRGIVMAGRSRIPVGARIVVKDTLGREVGSYTADPKSGKYLMVLPPENTYDLYVEADNYLKHHERFTLPKQCEYYQLYQEVSIRYLKDDLNRATAQKAVFKDAFFNINPLAKDYFDLDELEAKDEQLSPDVIIDTAIAKTAIVGRISHNDSVDARKIHLYLADQAHNIIKQATTDSLGIFRFDQVDADKRYLILADGVDIAKEYYGTEDLSAGVIVKGSVFLNSLPGEDHNPVYNPLQDIALLLVDKNKKILNMTLSDPSGAFILDNLPADPEAIARLNAEEAPFKENLETKDVDQVYSEYLKQLLSDTITQLAYNENIEILKLNLDSMPAGEMLVFKNILFDFDKSLLRNMSTIELEKIYAFMMRNPSTVLEIDGHTDWIGTDAYNMALGTRRSKSAVEYLISKGIDASRLIDKSYGESQPVANNNNPDGTDNPDGRQLNRRCEFKFSNPAHQYQIVMKF